MSWKGWLGVALTLAFVGAVVALVFLRHQNQTLMRRVVELSIEQERHVREANSAAAKAAALHQEHLIALRAAREQLAERLRSEPEPPTEPPATVADCVVRLDTFRNRVSLLEHSLEIAVEEIEVLEEMLELKEQESRALRDALFASDKRYGLAVRSQRRHKVRVGLGMTLACVGAGTLGYGLGRVL